MRHVFRATRIGWDQTQEFAWFDSNKYSLSDAEAQFKPYKGTTNRGYPYTGYIYDGVKYHDYKYIGEFEDDKMPRDNADILDYILTRFKK